MSGLKVAVHLVIEDQREHAPGMAAMAALEHVLATAKLHHIHTHDPLSRAYAAVLRHPKQARFDAKEIERYERNTHQNQSPGR